MRKRTIAWRIRIHETKRSPIVGKILEPTKTVPTTKHDLRISMLSRMNLALRNSQHAALPHAKTLLKATAAAYYSPSPKEFVPDEDYYHGHLMADHLEYLEDMIDKSVQLQETVRIVKDSHAAALDTNKKLKAQDVDRLISIARARNQEIAMQLERLQVVMDDNKKTFAVDAPDGEPDWHVIEELETVNELLASTK